MKAKVPRRSSQEANTKKVVMIRSAWEKPGASPVRTWPRAICCYPTHRRYNRRRASRFRRLINEPRLATAVLILSGSTPPEHRMAFCAERSWSQRGRANEGQGAEKIIPGGEHKKGGDDPQRLGEAWRVTSSHMAARHLLLPNSQTV